MMTGEDIVRELRDIVNSFDAGMEMEDEGLGEFSVIDWAHDVHQDLETIITKWENGL